MLRCADAGIHSVKCIAADIDLIVHGIVHLAPFSRKPVDGLINGLQSYGQLGFYRSLVRSTIKFTFSNRDVIRPLNPDIIAIILISELDIRYCKAFRVSRIDRRGTADLPHINFYCAAALDADIGRCLVFSGFRFLLRLTLRYELKHKFRTFQFLCAGFAGLEQLHPGIALYLYI